MLVYLAGPDVFLPDAAHRFAAMRAICERHGLGAVTPLDTLPGETVAAATAEAIAGRNEAQIRRCDAILANLSPFRGPGADPGTVYEVGFGRALGLVVFGYATTAGPYAGRVRAMPGSMAAHDSAGFEIEDFGLFENLMIACGIEASGGFLLAEDAADPWRDLAVFERCAKAAAARLCQLRPGGARPPGRPADSPPS